MPPFGLLRFGVPKLNKKYYSRKNGNVKHKMENVTFFLLGYIVGGGAFDAPAVKPFDYLQLSANSNIFKWDVEGAVPYRVLL